ncbi:hypothetical protein DdX_11293 [Ditylenchus destructor]|uniref:Uncharacterized protein n=1 Tax=Ditylenchus destructor TaxID=166010 RepID=A0AAD4QYE1_9BILA|nr:hypothetical protein DdX_11293 [Ditylenchus destructor]
MSQDHSLKLGQCNGISCKTSMELNNSDDLEESSNVKERLQKTELLEMKLKIQLYFCAFAVVLIIAVYLLIWYFTECWALPFQESPCKQPRDLPLMATNRNTLAEAVDDFPYENQNWTVTFPGGKDTSSSSVYSFPAVCGFVCIRGIEKRRRTPQGCREGGTCTNTRLKKLKKRIPLLYIATFICIMAEVALFFVLLAAQYYSGSSPVFAVKCNSTVHNNCRITEAFTDYHSFSTKLNSSLHKSCIGLKNSLSSPILEVRQMAWHYESKGIVTAVEHHLSVKQYYVDRRTMPRKIGNLLPNPELFLIRLPFLFMVIVCFPVWALAEGSIWQVFKCFQVDHSNNNFGTEDDSSYLCRVYFAFFSLFHSDYSHPSQTKIVE